MKIIDAYRAARDTTSTRIERARAGLFRCLFRTEFTRQEHEDDTLATLRSLGDDGTHLRQAVALALMGVEDRTLEAFLRRYSRGEETP